MRAVAPQREHMAALDAVARTAVQHDDLVLSRGQRVAVQRDDLAGHWCSRCMRRVVRELALRHRGEPIADVGLLADARDGEGGGHDLGLAVVCSARLARPHGFGSTDVGRFPAEHFGGGWILQRLGLAENPKRRVAADLAAHIGGVAARQEHPAFLRRDDARCRQQLVALEDHRFIEEGLDQVEAVLRPDCLHPRLERPGNVVTVQAGHGLDLPLDGRGVFRRLD